MLLKNKFRLNVLSITQEHSVQSEYTPFSYSPQDVKRWIYAYQDGDELETEIHARLFKQDMFILNIKYSGHDSGNYSILFNLLPFDEAKYKNKLYSTKDVRISFFSRKSPKDFQNNVNNFLKKQTVEFIDFQYSCSSSEYNGMLLYKSVKECSKPNPRVEIFAKDDVDEFDADIEEFIAENVAEIIDLAYIYLDTFTTCLLYYSKQ